MLFRHKFVIQYKFHDKNLQFWKKYVFGQAGQIRSSAIIGLAKFRKYHIFAFFWIFSHSFYKFWGDIIFKLVSNQNNPKYGPFEQNL